MKSSNPRSLDQFGNSIALSSDGEALAVGAYGQDGSATGVNGDLVTEFLNSAGAAYLY